MKIFLWFGLFLTLLGGCATRNGSESAIADRASIVGAWIARDPDGAGKHNGFELAEDGSALSINTATLTFGGWGLQGDRLTLQEQSTGSRGTTQESRTYRVRLGPDGSSMELIDSAGTLIAYRRERPDEKAANQRFPAAGGR